MPNDPTLYPSIPNPQQQLIQRIAALEARTAALERHRDLVLTPITGLLSSGSATLPWSGGRLWFILGGSVQGTGSGLIQGGALMNGNSLPYAGFTVTSYGALTYLAMPTMSAVIDNPLSLGMAPGNNTLTVAVNYGPGTGPLLSGMFIEWPQA